MRPRVGLRRRLFASQAATLAIVTVAAGGGWFLSDWVSKNARAETSRVELESETISQLSFELLQAVPHTSHYLVEARRQKLIGALVTDIENLRRFRFNLDGKLTALNQVSQSGSLHRELEAIRLLTVQVQRNLELTLSTVLTAQIQGQPFPRARLEQTIQDPAIEEIREHGDELSTLQRSADQKLTALKTEERAAVLLGFGVWMAGLLVGWGVGLGFAWRTGNRILQPLVELERLMKNPDQDVGVALQSPTFSKAPKEIVSLSRSFQRLVSEAQTLTTQLKAQASTDGLTAVGNRRRFDEVLGQEWKRGLRSGRPLSLLLLDVDHFKAYNDRWGHVQGDACLKSIAEVISSQVRRSSDLVCRVGGEEFAVLLPETGMAEAQRLAQEIVTALDSAALQHGSSPVADWVTASIGVASAIPQPESSERQLVERADRALYSRKRDHGRHGVTAADPAPRE
jgi:diguanylate cyclase (GGDEF)-like protein